MIQGFLLAYLNTADYFIAYSERELNKGFCDLYLEPFTARYPKMGHGYLIELKYMKRGQFSKARCDSLIEEADAQLAQYLADTSLARVGGHVQWTGITLIFHGWEMVWSGAK